MQFPAQTTVNTSTILRRLNASIPSAYTVFYDSVSSLYRGESNMVSGTDYSNATLATLLNDSVFSSLTGGRTHQEKVTLKGNLTLTDTLDVPPYTILDIQGKLSLANNSNCDMIRNSNYDSTDYAWYITIMGGQLYGNAANQASGYGIHFQGAQRAEIIGCRISSMKQAGIWLDAGNNYNTGVCHVLGNIVENCLSHGIYVFPTGTKDTGDHMICNNDVGGSTGQGIHLASTGACNVEANLVWNSDVGIHLYTSPRNNIIGNRLDNHQQPGLNIDGGSDGNVIVGNLIYDNGLAVANTHSGIRINDSDYNVITGNQSRNFAVGNTQKYGLIEEGTSDYNVITGNIFRNNTTGSISVAGANTLYRTATHNDPLNVV